MTQKRIFITGASGCIGHYIVETLIQETTHELFLLVRSPEKVAFDSQARPGIHLLPGDLKQIEDHAELLKTIDVAILTAAAWGDPQETQAINVDKTLILLKLLDPDRCEQVLYFSTASILDQNNQPLVEAGTIGTDYIRSKYECYQALPGLAIAAKITVLFPTLVFGGDDRKPMSHLFAGLPEVTRWINLIRIFRAEGSFHLVHAKDIAQVVGYLVDHPLTGEDERRLVLGNPAMTVNEAIEEAAHYMGRHVCFQLPLPLVLVDPLIKIFNVQMAEWDRFCLNYRHFVYQNPVNPSSYGLRTYCPTLSDVLKLRGIIQGTNQLQPRISKQN